MHYFNDHAQTEAIFYELMRENVSVTRAEIKKVIDACGTCKFTKKTQRKPNVRIQKAHRRWDVVGLDITEYDGYAFLVAVDLATGFALSELIDREPTTRQVRHTLQRMFSPFRLEQVKLFVSDLGSYFDSREFRQWMKSFSRIRYVAGQAHSSNGCCEVTNRIIKDIVMRLVRDKRLDRTPMDELLRLAYQGRNAIPNATGVSPYYLMMGDHPRWNMPGHGDHYLADALEMKDPDMIEVKRNIIETCAARQAAQNAYNDFRFERDSKRKHHSSKVLIRGQSVSWKDDGIPDRQGPGTVLDVITGTRLGDNVVRIYKGGRTPVITRALNMVEPVDPIKRLHDRDDYVSTMPSTLSQRKNRIPPPEDHSVVREGDEPEMPDWDYGDEYPDPDQEFDDEQPPQPMSIWT
jgi:hypothetical protein